MKKYRYLSCCFIFVVLFAGCQSNPNKPDDAQKIYTELGLGYMAKGLYALAEKKFKHAIELNDRSADAHHYLAELYRQQGRILVAEEEFSRALTLDRRNPALWNNYAVFLCGVKRYREAEKWFLKAAQNKSYKSRGEAYENAGVCVLEEGDKILARKYFKHAIGIASREVALLQLATLDYQTTDYASSVEALRRYEQYFKPTTKSLLLRIQVEYGLHNKTLAHQYSNRLFQLYPHSKEAQQAKALIDR